MYEPRTLLLLSFPAAVLLIWLGLELWERWKE
jgi:hypothetical protein